ncbi:MAG TPA: hypothetical protein VF816_12780 [Rhodocyclaceae bacterium]
MASASLILLACSSAIILWVLYGSLVAGCRAIVRYVLVAEYRRLATCVPRTPEIESQLAHIVGLLHFMRAADRRRMRRRRRGTPTP